MAPERLPGSKFWGWHGQGHGETWRSAPGCRADIARVEWVAGLSPFHPVPKTPVYGLNRWMVTGRYADNHCCVEHRTLLTGSSPVGPR